MSEAGIVDAEALAARIGATWQIFTVLSLRLGIRDVPGWVLGAWGVRDEGDGWGLSHLPTGLRLPYQFREAHMALAALAEIVPLTNDWYLPSSEIVGRFKGGLVEIALRHGASGCPSQVSDPVMPILNSGVGSGGNA